MLDTGVGAGRDQLSLLRELQRSTHPGTGHAARQHRALRMRDWAARGIVLFLPPALLLFTLFVVLPIGEAAWYSGFNWNGFGRPTNLVGWRQLQRFVFETRAFWPRAHATMS